MSTQAQIEANRNATSHGMSSIGDAVLPHEDRNEFERVLEAYVFEFFPKSTHEHYLLWEMAGARWRMARADRLMNIVVSGQVDEPEQNEPTDPELRIARMMAAKGDPIAKLERHRAAWERTYHRSMREFRAAQKFRLAQGSDDNAQVSASDSAEQNEPTPAPTQPYVRPEPKIGRNDYCPCGSGLKYKKCCLNKICVTPAAA